MFSRGQELPVFVTGVSKDGSLCTVWGQTDFDSFAILDELIQQIDASDTTTFKPVSGNEISVGDVVIAKYQEDGLWYRAEILQKESGTCKVFFMDYGNEESVSVNDMIYGPEQYFNIPPLATKFILADIQANDCEELSDSEMAVLVDNLQNLETDAQVLHEGSSGVPPTLRPFVEKSSQVPIAHTIIQSGCGIMYENDHFGFPNIQRTMIPPGQSNHVYVSHSDSAIKFWLQLVAQEDTLMDLEAQLQDVVPNLSPIPAQQIKKGAVCIANYEETYYRGVVSTVDYKRKTAGVYFIDYGNSTVVPFPEVLGLPDEYCTLPAQAIECSLKGSAVNSTDFDKLVESETVYARVIKVLESGRHVVHLSNDASSVPPSSEPVAAAGYQSPVEKKSPAVQVITSYLPMQLEDDALLDVCISHVEENGQFYCQLLSKAKALDALMCAIQGAELSPLKGAIREGTCCLAQSPTDRVMYRAQILSGSVAGPHVKYVDFGVTETVQPSSLYVLPNDLAEIPVRAVCCSLSDSSDMTSEQVGEILNKYLSKKPLIAEVLCKTPRSHEVVLYDTSVSDEPLVTVVRNKQSRPVASISSQSPQTSPFTAGSLQPPNITLHQPITIVESVLLKPTLLFAQFASFPVEDLEALGTSLHDFYTTNNVPCLPNCKTDDVCVTTFSEDGAYYRARVKGRREDIALVSFIDYGNQEKKNISELKVLVPQFCQLPVAGAVFDLGKHYDVVDPEMLASLIVDQELTVICEGQSKDGFICKLPKTESNMALLNVLRPKEAEAVPEPVQAQPTAKPAARMLGKSTISELSAPEGTSWQVAVPYAQDPDNIVIQLLKYKDDLDTLMDLMEEYCNGTAATHFQVSLGDFVIAKYSEDGGWYRASITGLKNGGRQFEVYFVDYGNYDTVALSDLRELPPKYTTLPAQALRCRLNGIAPEFEGTPWDPEHTNNLCETILDVEFTANIVSHRTADNSYTVDLIGSDGVSFNKTFLHSCGRLSRRYGGRESGVQQSTASRTTAAPLPTAGTKTIPHKQVTLDKYTEVIVPYGLGVDNFICQFLPDTSQLDEMQEAIAGDYAGSSTAIPRPVPGMSCCALYSEDNVWYRAEIEEVQGNTATVYFVDYGNHETVEVGSLRVLKDKYYLLPRQAIECELFGVEPVGAAWSDKANNTFLDMATAEERIVGCPVQKKNDGTYVVELVNSDNVPYHEKLIADGHAKAPVQQPPAPQNAPAPADKTSTAQRLKPISLASNEPVDVYIAHVDSASRIFCQLISEATKLEEVMAKLSETYSNLGPSELRLKSALVGSLCCAKYSEDNEWYRGEILAISPQKYHIRFVDYGNEEWVDSDDVRQIMKQLLSLPPQAILVSLENVAVIPGKEAQAKALIEQNTDDAVQVIPRSRSREGVHMTKVSVNGASLGDLLVQAGAARPSGPPSAPVARAQDTQRYNTPPVAAIPQGPQPAIGKYQINCSVEPNNQYKVIISWVESPAEFYCQSTQSEETLVQLSEKLKTEYDCLKPNQMSLPSLPTGTACVAYYEEDGNWYRGTVLKVRGQEAMIKYVDYGNRSKVPLSKVKGPSRELIEQEMEAVQCSLKGVSVPAGGEWPESVVSLFQELMADQPVLQILSLEGDRYIVDLNTTNCRSISEKVASLMRPKKSGWSNSRVPAEDSRGTGGRYGDRQPERQKWGGKQQEDFGSRPQREDRRDRDGGFASGDREDRGRNRDNGFGSNKPEWGRDKQRGGEAGYESRKPALGEQKSEGGWGDKSGRDGFGGRSQRDGGRNRDDGHRSNKPNFGGNAPSRNEGEWAEESAPQVSSVPAEKLAYPQSEVSSGLQDCYIAAVTNPLKFYVQYVSQEDELAEFASKVLREYTGLPAGKRAITKLSVNDPCCALFSDDGAWYRALVTNAEDSQATVVFVDYGNSTTINLSDVRSLTQELASVPLYALECKLKDMHQYTDEDVAKLNEIAAEKAYKMEFLSKSAPFEVAVFDGETNLLDLLPSGRQPAPVQETPTQASDYEQLPKPSDGLAYVSHIVNPGEFYLQFAEHEDQLTTLVKESAPSTAPLSQAVVGAPCAAMFSEDGAWYRACILSVTGPKAMVQFVDHGNCEEVDVATLQEVHTLSPPIGVRCQLRPKEAWSEEDTEKFSDMVLDKQLQVSLKGDSAPYTATITDQETSKVVNEEFAQGEAETRAEDKAECMFEYPAFDFSSLTGQVQVFVSHVDTPSKFYVQPVSMETQLNAMLDCLDEKYSSETCEVIQQPRVGMACCAKFTEDNVFYRAKIIDVTDGAVKVQFVDYGNCDTPPAEHIYQMRPDSSPMAVQCSLAHLPEPEGGWTDEVNDKLHEMTVDKVLTTEFHSTGELCEISLYEEEQNLATLLQEEFPQTMTAAAESSQSVPENATVQPEDQPEAAAEEKNKGRSRRRYSRLACPQEPIEAYISAVSSPGKFYVQPVSVDDDIAAMEETMCVLYKNGSPEPLEASEMFPGQMCCAQSTDDGEYYRALITSLDQETNKAEVLYVDYGNSETQEVNNLKKLEEKALAQPVMTLICRLAGVTDDEWTQEETTQFMEETEEKRLTITFHGTTEPYEVDVLERGEDITRRLFAYRLKTGDNSETTSQSEVTVEQTDEISPEEVRAVSAEVEGKTPSADEEELANDPQDGQDSIEVVNAPQLDEESEEQVQEKVEEVQEECAAGSLPSPCELTCGEKAPVTVSWVTSPSEFYIQLTSMETELSELEERLQEFYSEEEEKGELTDPVQAGVIYAAKYAAEEEEEKWYRARVQSVDAESIEVVFLDWGNSESLASSSLRPLDQQFLSLPAQCLKCSLSNVQPITDEWPDEAVTWFEETVTASEPLSCLPLQYTDNLWEVDLFDASEGSVANLLKQNGHAIEITEVEEEGDRTSVTTIPAASLDCKTKIQVCVSHLESPDNFWVQVKPNPVLEQLEADLTEFYSSSCPPAVTNVEVGNCYVIKNEESWDRARVKVVTDQFVTINYVDYGYDDDIEPKYVYPLSSHLATPVQSFQCRLVGVGPKEEEWSDEATELMRELTEDKCLLLQIVYHSENTEDGKYGIRLLDMGIPVSQMLADNNMAQLVDIKDLPSKMDTSAASDIVESVPEYIEKVITDSAAIYVDQQEESEGKSLEDDSKVELMEVSYLHGESPGKFYVQLCDSNGDFKNLEASLEEQYQTEQQDPDVALNKDDNVLVCADEKYYRASVLQVQDDQVEVCLLDYGGSRTVPKVVLRVLGAAAEQRLFSLPSQCMACKLDGIEATLWTEQAKEFFEGLVSDECLTVRILSQTEADTFSVYMYVGSGEDRRQSQGSSVNMQLVQEGHATVVPGCQLDIDLLDFESQDNSQLECSFLEESKLHSNSIGSLHDESLYTEGTEEKLSLARLQYNVGDEVRMRVSAVTDPDNVIVIDCMNTETFTVLSEQMQQYYNDKSTDDGEDKATSQPGQPAAVLLDSTWQRCEVVGVDGETVDVLLVDTGLQQTVQKGDLKVLEQRFCALPTQACRVSLNTDSDQWPQDVREKLEEASGVGQEDVTVTVIITSDTDGLVANITNKDGVALSSLCTASTSEPTEHSEESEPAPQGGQEEYATSIPQRPVSAGDKVPVTITAAASPVEFWCQLHQDNAAKLEEQMQATYCETSDHTITTDVALSEGQACAALIPAGENDEAWSRAVVRSSYDDVYTVQCVDSGRVATVARQNLRRLPRVLADEAGYAVLCQLPNVLPPDTEQGDWPEACRSQLEQYTDLVMTVIETPDDAPIHVALAADTTDVRQKLLDLKLAKPIPQLERKTESVDSCKGSEVSDVIEEEFETASEDTDNESLVFVEEHCKEPEQEVMDEDDEEDSGQIDELIKYDLDLTTQSLKEEIEEATCEENNDAREESEDDDVERCDEQNIKHADEVIERVSEYEKEVDEGIEEPEEAREMPEVLSNEQITETEDRDDGELEEKEAGELDVDESPERSDEPVSHGLDNVDGDSLEVAQSMETKGELLALTVHADVAEVKPEVDPGEVKAEDEIPSTTHGRSEQTEDDEEKKDTCKETFDESAGSSLTREDVEDLVSTEDTSKEDIDSGLVQDVHTDKSQGTGEDSSCEAADFHDLEGTEVIEEADSCSGCKMPARDVDDGVFTRACLEEGKGDAAWHMKSDNRSAKIRIPSIVVECYGNENTKELVEIVEGTSYVKPREEELKDESSDYLTASDVDKAVVE